MFTLRKQHFEEGKSLYLFAIAYHPADARYSFKSDRVSILYELAPLGMASATTVACRLTRSTISFSDSYPSYAKYKETATWERVDLSLTAKNTLTQHALDTIKHQMQEFEEEDAPADEWLADFEYPKTIDGFMRNIL